MQRWLSLCEHKHFEHNPASACLNQPAAVHSYLGFRTIISMAAFLVAVAFKRVWTPCKFQFRVLMGHKLGETYYICQAYGLRFLATYLWIKGSGVISQKIKFAAVILWDQHPAHPVAKVWRCSQVELEGCQTGRTSTCLVPGS